MNLPNKLTILRVILIPVFIVLFMLGYYVWATVVFAVASITDALDGYIARKHNLITNFGKIMDPLADKLLVTSALVCMVATYDIPAWMVIVILAREFTITALRSVAASEGIVIAAGITGKIKTVLQMVAVVVLILEKVPMLKIEFLGTSIGQVILWAAVIMTIISGVEYILKNKQLFSM